MQHRGWMHNIYCWQAAEKRNEKQERSGTHDPHPGLSAELSKRCTLPPCQSCWWLHTSDISYPARKAEALDNTARLTNHVREQNCHELTAPQWRCFSGRTGKRSQRYQKLLCSSWSHHFTVRVSRISPRTQDSWPAKNADSSDFWWDLAFLSLTH